MPSPTLRLNRDRSIFMLSACTGTSVMEQPCTGNMHGTVRTAWPARLIGQGLETHGCFFTHPFHYLLHLLLHFTDAIEKFGCSQLSPDIFLALQLISVAKAHDIGNHALRSTQKSI